MTVIGGLGRWVEFTGWSVFGGVERHGMVGQVEAVVEVPPYVVPPVLAWVRPLVGVAVPLRLGELRPCVAPDLR